MPCPFTGPEMFCAGPNFLSQPKNLTAFSASSKTFVPAQKNNFTNLHSAKIVFCASKKVFEEALYAVKFYGRLKKFGPAQRNIFLKLLSRNCRDLGPTSLVPVIFKFPLI